MSTQSQTDELMVRSLRFNSSNGDNLIDVSAQFNHSDEWLPFNMDVLSPTTLQKAATAGNSISLNSGSYTNAQFYIASTNGNNVRTAFYANEQGGAIQAYDNNGNVPLNLQPQGGALTVGTNMSLDASGMQLNVPLIPTNLGWATWQTWPTAVEFHLLSQNLNSGAMEIVPAPWVNFWNAGIGWLGGAIGAYGEMPRQWISPGSYAFSGIHTGGGLGTGATIVTDTYYDVLDFEHVIMCDGRNYTSISLPDPFLNDGREIKIVVTQADSYGFNTYGSNLYVSFERGFLPYTLLDIFREGGRNPVMIFPAGNATYGYFGPADEYAERFGIYPNTFTMTIKSTYIPFTTTWSWVIIDQSTSE